MFSQLISAAVTTVAGASLAFLAIPETTPTQITLQLPPEAPTQTVKSEPEPEKLSAHDKRQIQCLAENMYFEAGNQSEKGMIAVTNVVYNRIKDGRFPKTPCEVIHQRSRGVCQFSWTCSKYRKIRNWDAFERARYLAEKAVKSELNDVTRGAKFYHANYVNPGWRMTRVAQIGAHIFYNG